LFPDYEVLSEIALAGPPNTNPISGRQPLTKDLRLLIDFSSSFLFFSRRETAYRKHITGEGID